MLDDLRLEDAVAVTGHVDPPVTGRLAARLLDLAFLPAADVRRRDTDGDSADTGHRDDERSHDGMIVGAAA
ncbi:hypothetical protein [Nocardia sp. bgisy134]|uniref:hypothetical protein n=1 Tax=unclassified Nocardia TaxID=2637762 RepID=UPI003D74F8D0